MNKISKTMNVFLDLALGAIWSVVVTGALTGCGADGLAIAEGADTTAGEEPVELGELEQEYSAKHSTSYQFGVTTSSARLACNRTSTGQVCTIPSQRGGTFFLTSSLVFADATIARNVFSTINSALGGSTAWIESFDPFGTATIDVYSGACSGSTSSNNIEAYGCMNLVGTITNLTEGVADGDPVGQYQRHSYSIGPDPVTMDSADCSAKFSGNATAITQCKRHALGHAVQAWMGIGSRSDTAGGVSATWSRRTLATAGTVLSAMNAGDLCRLNSANYTNNGDFSEQSGTCSD